MPVRRRRRQRSDPEMSPAARAAMFRLQILTREQGALLHDESPPGKRRYKEIVAEKHELGRIYHADWKRRCSA